MLSKVMIVGAGTGGLCLAQGLKQSGIDLSVFERDRTPTDRLQGYRLHISSDGARALEHCLPATERADRWYERRIDSQPTAERFLR